MTSIRIPLALAAALLGSTAVQAQPITPYPVHTPNSPLEAQVSQLMASNQKLSAEVTQLRQELDVVKQQAARAAEDENTVYVTAKPKADVRYENWYGLQIGDQWRLQDDTPIRLMQPHQNELAYKVLPAGTVVTIIGAPRGVTGTYAVAVEQGTSGWATLRQ